MHLQLRWIERSPPKGEAAGSNPAKCTKIQGKEAEKAYSKGEVPIGAVIVKDGKIISRGYNLKETKKNTLKHAEIIAIEKASKKLDAWRLEECDIYVTMEPCPMCMGAIINSRIRKIYYGQEQ